MFSTTAKHITCDALSNTDSIYRDDVASVRFRLVHLIVHAHLVRLIVHLLAGYLIVDVLRSQTVVAAQVTVVVVVSGWRLERVERRHSSSIVHVKCTLVFQI